MKIKLLDIKSHPGGIFRFRTLKALSIDGKTPALVCLRKWKKDSLADYIGIMGGVKLLCSNRVVPLSPRLVKCKGYPDLIEIKAPRKNARLFCFIHNQGSDNKELVICTGGFWKTNDKKNSISKQDAAMKEAYRLRNIFLESDKEVSNERKK